MAPAAAVAAATDAVIGAPDVRQTTRDLFARLGFLDDAAVRGTEVGIYNAAIAYARERAIPLSWKSEAFTEIYLATARRIYANLNKDAYVANKRLADRLAEGEFAPHELATMAAENLYPEKWADIVQKEILKSQAAYEVTVVAMSDRIYCGKCKKNKVTYYEQQTRSADESCTIFFQCLQCGHRWKH